VRERAVKIKGRVRGKKWGEGRERGRGRGRGRGREDRKQNCYESRALPKKLSCLSSCCIITEGGTSGCNSREKNEGTTGYDHIDETTDVLDNKNYVHLSLSRSLSEYTHLLGFPVLTNDICIVSCRISDPVIAPFVYLLSHAQHGHCRSHAAHGILINKIILRTRRNAGEHTR
jgi:hypothetical protein